MALTGISICLAMNTVHAQIHTPSGTIQGTSGSNSVGIGVTTPTHKLVVSDNISNTGIMKLASTNEQAFDKWWIGFSHGTNTNDNMDRARVGVDIADGGAGSLFFSTGGPWVAPPERMRIDQFGKVGIGGSPYTDFVLSVENTVPGLPGGIRSYVANNAVSGTGIYSVAYNNSGDNTGIEALAQLGAKCIAGKFDATQSDEVFGIDASATGLGNSGSFSYGGSFKASGAEEQYGVKSRALSSSGNKTNYAIYAEAEGSFGQPTDNYGVYTIANLNDGMKNYGVYAKAFNQYANGPNENYGVYAFAESNSSNTINVGVYAKVKGGVYNAAGPNQSYAGVFEGDVVGGNVHANAALFNGGVVATAPGYYQLSDQKFKKNVESVENAIDKLMVISSKTYEFKGKDEFPTFNFSSGRHYGFIAQELEKVVPEAIEEFTNPAQYDNEGNKTHDAVSFKSVNYTALIPILTAGIQEQQAIIETQNAKIDELEERLAKLEKGGTTGIGSTGTTTVNGAALYQNTPNPFNSHTEIGYKLPQQYTEAKIMVFDMNGRQVRTVPLVGEAEGKVSFYPNELAAGMYMYSLVIDGREIDTKRMILSGR